MYPVCLKLLYQYFPVKKGFFSSRLFLFCYHSLLLFNFDRNNNFIQSQTQPSCFMFIVINYVCVCVCVCASSFDFSMYICRRHPRFIISGQLVNFISIAEAHTSSKTILTKNHLCFMSHSFYTHKNIFITLFIGIIIMASHCLYLSFYI